VCPPYPSERGELGCVLEVFDFNVHPKKLPEADNGIRNSNPVQAPDRAANDDTEGDIENRQTDLSRSPTPSLSSSSSSASGSPSTRPSTPSSGSSIAHKTSFTVHTEPSRISASGVFIDDVISKLPYTRTVRKDLDMVYSGFMIDDERIVGIKVGCFLCVVYVSWN
jgi:hypothetical protein